jgi:hypothetical protein
MSSWMKGGRQGGHAPSGGAVRVVNREKWRICWVRQGRQPRQPTKKSLGGGYRFAWGFVHRVSSPDFYIYPDGPDGPDGTSVYAGFENGDTLTAWSYSPDGPDGPTHPSHIHGRAEP